MVIELFYEICVAAMWPSVEGILTICSNGSPPWNKMAAMPIYVKIDLKIFSRTKKAESWYIASGTQGLPSLFK